MKRLNAGLTLVESIFKLVFFILILFILGAILNTLVDDYMHRCIWEDWKTLSPGFSKYWDLWQEVAGLPASLLFAFAIWIPLFEPVQY